jgi:hypothetical protein
MHLLSLARWLARKAVKAEWRAQGRKVQYIDASEITEASNIYLTLHRNELLKEAWEHPYTKQLEMYEEPLSDSSLGRWRTLALSSPEASSAISSVAVTSSAFIVVHSFQAMM